MRRFASVGLLIVLLFASNDARADECSFDPVENRLICTASGDIPADTTAGADPEAPPPLRYLYTRTDPVVGDCWYGSAVPGGLDLWDPGNDGDVLAITATLPRCPVAPAAVDAAGRAWEVFRSFPLTPPLPQLQPADNGVVALPTYLAATEPDVITHTEVLPDGRTLEVRAAVTLVTVDWGDAVTTRHEPRDARRFPEGSVTHEYGAKTCTTAERTDPIEAERCHPFLAAYPITTTFTWTGEWSLGSGWIELGTLNQATTIDYDVDEVLGVLQP